MTLDVTTLRGRSARNRWNRSCIGDIFERIACYDPDRVVIHAWPGAYENQFNSELTAGRADALANQYANKILASNIKPGDIVMLLCNNSAEALLAKIGLAKAGVTAAPLNPSLNSDILDALVELCKPSGVVVDAECDSLFRPIVEKHGLNYLHAIVTDSSHQLAVPTFSDFIAGSPAEEPSVDIGGDDIWELLFTSGSTSTPKAVMVSHHNTMYYALSYVGAAMIGLTAETQLCLCSFLPVIYHVGDGIVFSALLGGGKLVLGRSHNARQIAEAIDRHQVTCLWGGAPHAINAVTQEFEKDANLSSQSLRSIIFGWAPLNPPDYDRIKIILGADVRPFEIIGQTEVCCGHRFWLDNHLSLYRSTAPLDNYVGEPHPLIGAIISTSDGEIIRAEDERLGEALYRSPSLMAGYYKRPDETAEALRGDWFHGGDAFRWGGEKQRILADRYKDIVKTGGENVTSIRVEAAINKYPSIIRSAIVGLPHQRWGEAVTAFVRINDGATLDEAALKSYLKDHLAAFEIPKRFVVVERFPETVGGKIQKHILRANFTNLYRDEK